MQNCPLLEKCGKMGMKCEERKFATCHLYKQILKEMKELKMRKLQNSLSESQIRDMRKENARKMLLERWKTEREIEMKANQIEQ